MGQVKQLPILDHTGNPATIPDGTRAGMFDLGQWSGGARGSFESADTSRLNEAHWANANDVDINSRLYGALQTLRGRSFHERQNNPLVAGMIWTHKVDLIGYNGPTLSVIAEDDNARTRRYAANLERVFYDWWQEPDITGINAGVDLLLQDLDMLWLGGESLWQFVDDEPTDDNPISLRVNALHPRLLDAGGNVTRFDATRPGDRQTIVMGVETNAKGKVVRYHLEGVSRPIPASDMLHLFRQEEPGQRRGIPWLASVLQTIADLRDYDEQILDAARQAADYSIMLTSNHDGIEPIDIKPGTSTEIRRREITAVPPGWTATQMKPEHPPTRYIEYRRERHGDLGRAVNMPRLITRMDASDHNFSSARFDARGYDRSNAATRAWLERRQLNPTVRKVEREARMRGLLNANRRPTSERPGRIRFVWTWGGDTHIASDPLKEIKAAETRLKTGVSGLRDEVARFTGRSLEAHVQQLQRDGKLVTDANLPQLGQAEGEPTGERQVFQKHMEEVVERVVEEYIEGIRQEERHRAQLGS